MEFTIRQSRLRDAEVHCLLFCNSEGLPITEYLPEGHQAREIYGLIKDPHPDKGRALGRVEEQQGRKIAK